MNENVKTITFWGVAVAMLAVGTFFAWPTTATNNAGQIAGSLLFEQFKDPLAASNLRIVTYDSEQGSLEDFEVRKDAQTQAWTIPSRSGYPADAVEQMTLAANSFVGLNILDIQTENAEDHDDLGVSEPNLDELEVGDEGVGRLVTFKDESQNTLASLIIGDPVKAEPGKIYVRKPGEDPVYVVKFDPSPLTTRFRDWIEEDLLQLSSINIESMEIDDYSASIGLGNQIQLDRNFIARVVLDGTNWVLAELSEYTSNNALAEAMPVDIPAGATANKVKLDEMKNALDDLKIVNVIRKPDGMSANLRADKELVSDTEAIQSLASRGFFPMRNPAGETEILSANGATTVSMNDGVQYILRFGSVEGLSEEEESIEGVDAITGVNRYLLVTAKINESHFPPPALQEKPETLEDLDRLMKPSNPESAATNLPVQIAAPVDTPDSSTSEADATEPQDDANDQGLDEPNDASADSPSTEDSENNVTEDSEPSTESGETEANGQAEGSGSGGGLQEEQAETASEVSESASEEEDTSPEENVTESVELPTSVSDSNTISDSNVVSYEDLTQEEKLELLEAEQEKVIKANNRKLDDRTEKMEVARRRVSDLNARFADWYYVIPEATYRQLRISREELLGQVVPTAPFANPASIQINPLGASLNDLVPSQTP